MFMTTNDDEMREFVLEDDFYSTFNELESYTIKCGISLDQAINILRLAMYEKRTHLYAEYIRLKQETGILKDD